ncbi:hypothetical protein AVEN_51015-1 [Araneus ventricosus]|uniref:Uncharacterized protein n=1 Tax=Araneus ventricosus TaxID=182803 RepID=A0A4Y2PDR6_ARAVE|nr:hypothetical protein AVEN_51015-1 [Araneus ventricosus]
MSPTLATLVKKTKVPENDRIFSPSLLLAKLWRYIWNFPVTSHASGKGYKYSEVQNDFDRLWSANAFGISLESCLLCELVSCYELGSSVFSFNVVGRLLRVACVYL